MTWHLMERLGLSWPEQVISLPLHGEIMDGPWCVIDNTGRIQPAQCDGDCIFCSVGLAPGEEKMLRLETGAGASDAFSTQLRDGFLELRSKNFGIRLGWTDRATVYETPRASSECVAPIQQLCGKDGIWFGHGLWVG